VFGVATVYDVVSQRLYVCWHVRWLTFGDVLQWSPSLVSTRGDLARLNWVLLTMDQRWQVALYGDLYKLWYQILCSALLLVYY